MSVEIVTIPSSHMRGKLPKFPFPSKGWVAGGAIRGWFTGAEKLSDVDVFFPDNDAFNAYLRLLEFPPVDELNLEESPAKEPHTFKSVYETPNAVTMTDGKILVQCIRADFYPDIGSLLDSFDFTVCQFAWDGMAVFATGNALISVLRDHLGVHKITDKGAVDSLRRAFKYGKKGFHPCNGTILALANSLRGLTEQQIMDAVTISPNGGRRILRFD